MVKLTINGKKISVPEGTTILDAAREAGIFIPTLCFLKDINEIGACRVCVVEVEGCSKLVTACNNLAAEGMVIRTNSPKVRESRRNNVELILSQHDGECSTCVRSGNCSPASRPLPMILGFWNCPLRKNCRIPGGPWISL